MVKGVSRQVILVRPQESKLFEQAIFILRDDVPKEGISDEILLCEARKAASAPQKAAFLGAGPVWACCGAACTGLVWLLTALL